MKTIKFILSAGVAGGLFAAMVAFAGGVLVTNKPPATADATNAVPGDICGPRTRLQCSG